MSNTQKPAHLPQERMFFMMLTTINNVPSATGAPIDEAPSIPMRDQFGVSELDPSPRMSTSAGMPKPS